MLPKPDPARRLEGWERRHGAAVVLMASRVRSALIQLFLQSNWRRVYAESLHSSSHYLFANAFPLFLQPLTRKYLRLSSQATVLHLKKFLAKKLSLEDHKDVSDSITACRIC